MTTLTKESPCKGQGDESGNSIISTPDSSSAYRNMNVGIPEQISDAMEKSQFDENQPMTYTTLVAKQERMQNEVRLFVTKLKSFPHKTFYCQASLVQVLNKVSPTLRLIKWLVFLNGKMYDSTMFYCLYQKKNLRHGISGMEALRTFFSNLYQRLLGPKVSTIS